MTQSGTGGSSASIDGETDGAAEPRRSVARVVVSRTLLVAGVVTILAGGSAAAGAKYTEVRTEWEMNRELIRAERDAIAADPDGEFEELVGLYREKGLDDDLARRVAKALTDRDPVAAHCDVELRLELSDAGSGAATAGLIAGLSYGAGASIPLLSIMLLPIGGRVEITFALVLFALALTGCFAAWLTGLPAVKLILRNVLLGTATMLASLFLGLLIAT